MNERAAARPMFTVRVSTVFIVLSLLCFGIPNAIGWTPHDRGWPGILFICFPMLAAVGLLASIAYLVKARTAQAWLEVAVAFGILFFAALAFLF